MSTFKRVAIAVTVALLALGTMESARIMAQPGAPMSLRADFRDLDDYGEWYKIPKVGWVWAPYADDDWRPFMYGRWQWTSDGWMWQSYEPFGWLVSHYGYWINDNSYGWMWVPGYDWSPARVNWIVTNSDISWAPMVPPGYVRPQLFAPSGFIYWTMVPHAHFLSDNVYEYRLSAPRPGPARQIVRRSAPDVAFVRRAVGRPVPVLRIQKNTQVTGQKRFVRPIFAPVAPGRPAPVAPVGPKYKRPHGPSHGPREGYVEQPRQPAPAREGYVGDKRGDEGQSTQPQPAPRPAPRPVVQPAPEPARPGPGAPPPRRDVAPGGHMEKRVEPAPAPAPAPKPAPAAPKGRADNPPPPPQVAPAPAPQPQVAPAPATGPGKSENAPGHNKGGESDGGGKGQAKGKGQEQADSSGRGPKGK